MNLRGKTALVTGGAVRVGRAISVGLARAGVRVAVHYGQSDAAAREVVAEIESEGGTAVAIAADLSRSVSAANDLFASLIDALGPPDILVNSAAIFASRPLPEVTEEEWDRHFAINLKSPFFLCQQFAKVLPTDRRGHIVNIADWRALRPPADHLVYTITKAGVATLTKSLAQALAPRIQVNAIAPGAILPPPGADASYLARLADEVPLKRSGSPDDIVRAVLYLLESDFVTGEVTHVSGGEEL